MIFTTYVPLHGRCLPSIRQHDAEKLLA